MARLGTASPLPMLPASRTLQINDKMSEYAGIEAKLAWMLLFSMGDGFLRESSAIDYAGILEGMEAAELLALVKEVKRRLVKMGVQNDTDTQVPVELYIDKKYRISMGGPGGVQIPFRPLVRAVFILFLKHPEGILLKDRARFQKDLEDIYKVIAPDVDAEDRRRRILKLTDLEDNAFSENLSVLNATLERILPVSQVHNYKVQGNNGYPRRIPLSPLLVHWESASTGPSACTPMLKKGRIR